MEPAERQIRIGFFAQNILATCSFFLQITLAVREYAQLSAFVGRFYAHCTPGNISGDSTWAYANSSSKPNALPTCGVGPTRLPR